MKQEFIETPHIVERNAKAGCNPEKRKDVQTHGDLMSLKTEEEFSETSSTVASDVNAQYKEGKGEKKFKPVDIENALPWHRRFVFTREDIAEVENRTGIKLKNGRFTKEEDNRIRKNWKAYSRHYNLSFFDVFCRGHLKKQADKFIANTHVYAELARKLPLRTARSVSLRARVILHPHYDSASRPFSASERERIKELQEVYGKNWNKISLNLQRTPSSVSQYSSRMMYKRGQFSTEEQDTIVDWVRKHYGEEEAFTRSTNDIDWKRMQLEVIRNRCIQQLKDFWSNWITKLEFDPVNRKAIALCILDRLERLNVQKEADVPWSEMAAELACDERYLRHRFADMKFRYATERDGQSIAAYQYWTSGVATECKQFEEELSQRRGAYRGKSARTSHVPTLRSSTRHAASGSR